MKTTLSQELINHLKQPVTTLAWLVRIQRIDGVVIGFTNFIRNITFQGLAYTAKDGMTPSDIEAISNFDNDNFAFDGFFSETGFERTDILTERYDNADVKIYLVNYTDPDNQYCLVRSGRMGTIKPRDNDFNAEILGLSQFLQNDFGEVCSQECRADLGDDRCKVNLDFYAESGVVTGVSTAYPRKVFAAEILSRQWVNSDEELLTNIIRWSNNTISSNAIAITADKILVAPAGTFEHIDVGSDYVISGFSAYNNNRTFYVAEKGANNESLTLKRNDLNIAGHLENDVGGEGLTFEHHSAANDRLASNIKGRFSFLYVGCEFDIYGSGLNDGTYTVAAISPDFEWVEINETFADQSCDYNDVLTFQVWPRVDTSTAKHKYYGHAGMFSELIVGMRIEVTKFGDPANNGTKTIYAVAEDGHYIEVNETLVAETRKTKDVLFFAAAAVEEAAGNTITIYPSPGPEYSVYHRDNNGDIPWDVSGSNWFTNGKIRFVSGDNAGLGKEIQEFDLEQWSGLGTVPSFRLLLNMPYEIKIGDKFIVYAGCDKSAEMCASKFGNIENFRGEPFVPGEEDA